MSDFEHNEWRKHVSETENLEALTTEQLKEHLRYFNGVRLCKEVMTDQTPWGKKNVCDERIRLLREEKHYRRSRKPSWVAIASLFIARAGLCLGIYNFSQSKSEQTEERPTPTATVAATATPQQSPTETPSQ